MYGVVFSFKDPFDTKDMRTTAGGDARYDIDFPARDHVLVEQLRNKGAIIFAKAVNTEYNGRAGDPGGRHTPDKVLPSVLGYQRSTWGGNPANPYDTTRSASLGSSSGSGVSVSANLVMASLGEETRASCRGPANHNAVALILPHKSMLGFDGGAIGADIYCDRSGILCRTIGDCAKVLDALKDPVEGYYDPRDPYTTVPRSSVLTTPYASHARMAGNAGRAHRHPPRHRAGVHGVPAGLEDRRADRHRRRDGDQDDPRRPAGGDPRGVVRSPVEAGSRHRDHEDGLPASAGQPRARDHARPALPAGTGRPAGVQGIRGGDRADRVHARQGLRHGHDAADRLLRRARGGTHHAPRQSRHRDHPGAGARDGLPVPHPAIPDPPRRGLEGARIHGDARRLSRAQRPIQVLGRRSARRVPELGRGERSAQSPWASVRASTSGSCCANCCAGWT